jgi:hypothetical protein
MFSSATKSAAQGGGYNLTKSLRFRASASAHLSRSYAGGAGNTTTFTVSVWAKRGQLGSVNATQYLFSGGTGANCNLGFGLVGDADALGGNLRGTGGTNYFYGTSAVFRDPSAWYHIVLAVDTTQATASNRVKLYVNGVLQTLGTANYPTQNLVLLDTGTRYLSAYSNTLYFFDGYFSQYYFIDGQQLTASSFGSTNATTGVWQPAKYTGTYGTNGFYLPFTNTASTTTLGYDSSGNSNNWTTNNISLTTGVNYDSMNDVPTLTSATAANYCVMNPLQLNSVGLSNGNLTYVAGTNGALNYPCGSTLGIPSGKFYWEINVTSLSLYLGVGIASVTDMGTIVQNNLPLGFAPSSYNVFQNGDKCNNSTTSAYQSGGYATGNVIGVAFDATNGKIWFSKNGVYPNSGDPVAGTNAAFTSIATNTFLPALSGNNSTLDANFGQRAFAYTPPTGFLAPNTYNLSTSTIVQGNKVMDATTYSGSASAQSIANTASFKPDLVWVKSRNQAYNNVLIDSVRGTTKFLASNNTNDEGTDAGSVTSFNANGFSVGTAITWNQSGSTYVGWQWQAGQGTNTTNTNGSISSTVSVNASAGFSVVTYSGGGLAGTVGHGLGVAPSLIIVKDRVPAVGGGGFWFVYHSALGNTQYLLLSLTNSAASSSAVWNNTSPTSSVFSVGSSVDLTGIPGTFVAYCWSEIAGFSKFGSYTGNNSPDGPFIYTGFRPKFVLFKAANNVSSWQISDSSRSPYNVSAAALFPNSSNVEYTIASDVAVDFLSNGFKLRGQGGETNYYSGGNYIYAAFAENPFKNALAR